MGSTADATPESYIASLDEPRRTDISRLDALIQRTAPHLAPHVDRGMLGYGRYHYRYATGRQGESSIIAVASRKGGISIYVSASDGERYLAESYADRLGKVSVGKSCVRMKRLDDVDADALGELIRTAARTMKDTPGVTVVA